MQTGESIKGEYMKVDGTIWEEERDQAEEE
jgi:hypothetical protein